MPTGGASLRENEPMKGTAFVVLIPAAPDAVSPANPGAFTQAR
jgi:hypothetical protein